MEGSISEDPNLEMNIDSNEKNININPEKQLNDKILSEEKINQTTMKIDHIIKDLPPKPVLSYNPDELRWNSTHTINLEHVYCYCAQDRTLDEPDFQCKVCKNFFHARCFRSPLKEVLPFLINYTLVCSLCSNTNTEEFHRSIASWKAICGSVIANLTSQKIISDHPEWTKDMISSKNHLELTRLEYFFTKKADIVPFLENHFNWKILCIDKEKASSWQSTLGSQLLSSKDAFRAQDEGNRSQNSPYSLIDTNLFQFRSTYTSGSHKLTLNTSRKRQNSIYHDENIHTKILKNSSIISNSIENISSNIKKENPENKKDIKEPRERKETWKKKESHIKKKDKVLDTNIFDMSILPRIRPPPYRPSDFNSTPRLPTFIRVENNNINQEFYSLTDQPFNRKAFRYLPCEATPLMPNIMYRQIELPPYRARISWNDTSQHVFFDRDGMTATTEKGFRMARANVCMNEGDWYFEFIIERGNGDQGGFVRIGIARREASLDAPVGFDGYSYALRDKGGQKVHMSRPRDFMESFGTGDVIGFHVSFPKTTSKNSSLLKNYIFRDRIPIRYKGQLYFEQLEYIPSKEMEDLMNPASNAVKPATPPPIIKNSFIKVYKNGKFMGTAFQDLYAFLPPNSQTIQAQDINDGMLGYYPAVSMYHGGIVRLNFGPLFKHPPKDVPLGSAVIPLFERYTEQIAEDIVWDLIDEIDLSFSSEIMDSLSAIRTKETTNSSEISEIKEIEDI
ncbi:hypothetical protein T552_02550 [Pneumocystis carinii B80]|uniref:B30.2/SPRY domain-containing protein n=1 Tax=Pneumocystis carinii (strain B80) TaxID=1408658 RepID=A0A0W4ZFD4_PNEC8|nr:hypothetical protein T552_02550 [Pneumocystis carinii B80]KTW27058.1 hypothetical protein T552_02550 [Pneumocystis carinii B80]